MPRKKTVDVTSIDKLTDFEFPEPDFFKPPKIKKTTRKTKLVKHASAYEAFVKWSATPKKLREPKTVKEFEKVWKLPKNYTSSRFRKKRDLHEKKMKYFWDWVMDKYPDVLYAVYQRAVTNSTADAKIFSDIVAKRMDAVAPIKSKMTPFMLVGVPQEKINALFTPEGVEEAEEAQIIDE